MATVSTPTKCMLYAVEPIRIFLLPTKRRVENGVPIEVSSNHHPNMFLNPLETPQNANAVEKNPEKHITPSN
jgi:predicted acyl esterase